MSPSERSFVIASRGRPLSVVLDRFAVFPDAELVHLLRPIGYQRGEILALLRERVDALYLGALRAEITPAR